MNHAFVAEPEVFVVVLPVDLVDGDVSLARHRHRLIESSSKNIHANIALFTRERYVDGLYTWSL